METLNLAPPEANLCKTCNEPKNETHAFCGLCGDIYSAPRITTDRLVKQALRAFDLDYGFIFTFISLITKPGQTIKNYLLGDRKRIVNPFRYYLLSLVLQSFFIHANHAEYIPENAHAGGLDLLLEFTQQYPNLLIFPYLLMASYLLGNFASHHKYNNAETFMFNIFSLAQANFLFSFFEFVPTLLRHIPIFAPSVPEYNTMFFCFFPVIYFLYGLYAFTSFYRERDLFAIAVFGFVLLFSLLVYVAIIGLVVVAISFIWQAIYHPDLFSGGTIRWIF